MGVVGLGYAGLCTAACLAQKFTVVGVDVDPRRISMLNAGSQPFFERGLAALLEKGRAKRALSFSNDFATLSGAEFIFVTVGTPSNETGSIDLTQVKSACALIGQEISIAKHKPQIVIKSTVVPGTSSGVVKDALEAASGKRCGSGFGLSSNPEFLREGSAVDDTLRPARLIIGSVDDTSGRRLLSLYRRFYSGGLPPVVETTSENAELIKYASNAFLATKISFVNLIANICERLPGADVEDVAEALGLDPRIGKQYLRAGPGFGGSCFPKDLRALRAYVDRLELDGSLVRSVLAINDSQPRRVLSAVEAALSTLKKKEVAVLGVAFKEGSDDVRESRAIVLARSLLAKEAKVRVYDPMAMPGARREMGDSVEYSSTARECIKGADAAIVMTPWDEFKRISPNDFLTLMRTPVLFDARRIYDPKKYGSRVNFMAVGFGSPR